MRHSNLGLLDLFGRPAIVHAHARCGASIASLRLLNNLQQKALGFSCLAVMQILQVRFSCCDEERTHSITSPSQTQNLPAGLSNITLELYATAKQFCCRLAIADYACTFFRLQTVESTIGQE